MLPEPEPPRGSAAAAGRDAHGGHRADDGPTDVVVLVGGDPVPTELVAPLPADAFVIAADSGAHLAAQFGLPLHLIVGDLDSIEPDRLADYRRAGVPVDRHPTAKDRTDLAIALDAALRFAPARVTLLGGHGGRLDHLLGNALVLAANAYRELTLTAWIAAATVTVVRDHRELLGRAGDYVSLLPVHGAVTGITTGGLRFPLADEDLPAGSTRGISNQFLTDRAAVRVRSGVLLAVQPGAPGPSND